MKKLTKYVLIGIPLLLFFSCTEDNSVGPEQEENDENSIVFQQSIEVGVVWGEADTFNCPGSDNGEVSIYSAAVFDPVENAKKYTVKIFDHGNTGLFRTDSWVAGQSPNYTITSWNTVPDSDDFTYRGKFYIVASGTGGCWNSIDVDEVVGKHQAIGGYAEIIIELED